MKRYFSILFTAACLLLGTACTDFQPQIDELQKQIDELSQTCDRSDANITALETAVNAIKSGNPVESVEPVKDGGNTVGYTLTFKEGGKVTVYNQACNVTVGSDNGKYFWKANGEWLKDSKGNRIEVGGEEAPAPQFRIEDSVLEMSLDGGKSWNEAAVMEKPLIAKVEDSPAAVTITLTEGGVITIPKVVPGTVVFTADTVQVFDGKTVEASYTIAGAPEGTNVYAIGSNGWKAEVVSQDANGGKVSVTAPEGAVDSDVILTATDGKGKTYFTSIRCIARGVQPKFEVLGYASFGAAYATRANYQAMADAGFTVSHAGFSEHKWEGPLSLRLTLEALDQAEGTGVKLCIPVMDWFGGYQQECTLGEFINSVKDHPALWGYSVGDEPSVLDFDRYATVVEEVRKYDSVHPWYTVFLPVAARVNGSELNGTDTHKEYVDAVCQYYLKYPTQFLPFDMYPVHGNTVAFWWYSALEDYFYYAQQYDIPLSGFACCVQFDGYEYPTLEGIRLQNYTNLAYGCQALQYFTYLCPPYVTEGWVDGSAPMNRDGSLSPVYDMVKQLNTELNNQAFVFLGSKVKWVRHSTNVEALPGTFSTTKLQAKEYTSVGFYYFKAPQHTVISLLENDGCRYLVIVNQSLQVDDKLQMELNEEGEKMQIVNKDGTLTPITDFVTEQKPVYTLGKGDALILKLD